VKARGTCQGLWTGDPLHRVSIRSFPAIGRDYHLCVCRLVRDRPGITWPTSFPGSTVASSSCPGRAPDDGRGLGGQHGYTCGRWPLRPRVARRHDRQAPRGLIPGVPAALPVLGEPLNAPAVDLLASGGIGAGRPPRRKPALDRGLRLLGADIAAFRFSQYQRAPLGCDLLPGGANRGRLREVRARSAPALALLLGFSARGRVLETGRASTLAWGEGTMEGAKRGIRVFLRGLAGPRG